MKRVLVIGAYSTIAAAIGRRMAERGDRLFLVGRTQERLTRLVNDLRTRGAESVACAALDVNELSEHAKVLATATDFLEALDIVLIAHGTLPDMSIAERDPELVVREFNTNAVSTIAILMRLAAQLETQGNGSIVVLTSVAGDRGRRSNYLYGSAKAAVSVTLQGLRGRLAARGIQVLDVKPGFVDTPMTANFTKGLLWTKPEAIARGVLRAIDRRKDVVYLPWFWRPVMTVIRHIPEKVFKRLPL